MNTGVNRSWRLVITALLLVYFLPFAWYWQLLVFIFLFWLILAEPILKLMIAEIGATHPEEDDVVLALRLNEWQTAMDIRKSIQKNQGIKRVSLLKVMTITYDLAQRKIIEGRERRPLQPAFYGNGNMWEYRQKTI